MEPKNFKEFTVLYNMRMTDRQTVVIHDYAAEQAKLDQINEQLLELSDYSDAKLIIDRIKNL